MAKFAPLFLQPVINRMGRLLGIDYGRKRCGIAVTDTLRIVASGLATVATAELPGYVTRYVASEPVDAIVVGLPRQADGSDSESMRYITPGINRLRKLLPDVKIVFWDERYTSVLAHRAMIDGGMRRSARRDKGAVDEISAVIILNDYLQSREYEQNRP